MIDEFFFHYVNATVNENNLFHFRLLRLTALDSLTICRIPRQGDGNINNFLEMKKKQCQFRQ
jgi:hypothetical protein